RHLMVVVLKARNSVQRELATRALLRYGFARAAQANADAAMQASPPPEPPASAVLPFPAENGTAF
ncbi:MAG: hypothetical protein ACREKK_01985, partial [Candidatus Methylomirabilales bacterium]